MRLIDADELEKNLSNDLPYKGSVKRVLIQAPTVDAEPVVYCKDCKHSNDSGVVLMCDVLNRNDKYCHDRQYNSFIVDEDHFCKWGKRRDGD